MVRAALVAMALLSSGVAAADSRLTAAEARRFSALQHKLEKTVNRQLGIKTAPAPKNTGGSGLIKQMLRTDRAMLRAMLARLNPTTVQLRPGDDTVRAFREAKRSGVPTVIKMDFGSLHVGPGQETRFEVTTGNYRNDTGNSVRRAHNLAYEIGPVVVTRKGAVIGTATRDVKSEKPLLKALGARL